MIIKNHVFEEYIIWVNSRYKEVKEAKHKIINMFLVLFLCMYRCLYLNVLKWQNYTKILFMIMSGGYDHREYLFSSIPFCIFQIFYNMHISIIRKRDMFLKKTMRSTFNRLQSYQNDSLYTLDTFNLIDIIFSCPISDVC